MRLKLVFALDTALLLSAAALEAVPFTGLVVHEWLGMLLGALFVVHLLFAWAWIESQTRGLARRQSIRARVNYLLNLSLFACMTAVIVSGIMVSQHAVPALTGKPAGALGTNFRWESIHGRFSDFGVVLTGVHLAMNWDWAVAATRKLVGRRSVREV
jgi:cytochrome b561